MKTSRNGSEWGWGRRDSEYYFHELKYPYIFQSIWLITEEKNSLHLIAFYGSLVNVLKGC